MIVAGEASGDLHGARLVQALRRMDATIGFVGIGGDRLRAAGVRTAVDAASLSVVGITEVVSRLPDLWRGLRAAKEMLRTRRPDLLVLIDFPDFNLLVAGAAKKLGVPVLYYISPQIWAWRQGRVHRIGRRIDHMAVILPFEADFYRRHGIPVTFVGHPLLDAGDSVPAAAPAPSNRPVIGLFPGSRNREVARILPPLLDAARRLKERFPDTDFRLSRAASVAAETMGAIMASFPDLALVPDPRPAETIFRECTMILAASGTLTLEAAMAGVPMVIVYRVSPMSYWMGRALIRVPHIGLANLIAGEGVSPELIQGEATGRRIAEAAAALIEDSGALAAQRRKLLAVRDRLGVGGASRRVAQLAMDLMDRGRSPAARDDNQRMEERRLPHTDNP